MHGCQQNDFDIAGLTRKMYSPGGVYSTAHALSTRTAIDRQQKITGNRKKAYQSKGVPGIHDLREVPIYRTLLITNDGRLNAYH